ncbi:CAP domain-containing protein [Paenibacillus sp. PL91]|uniref:CAP domain-containing protein n=1 Tax=Paenibacillus sp. PL91 TaxID=2729538 RepID=UPI00145CEBC7|nr:CAP domain-containing protein [Paenibacillus sp. PL91]MBC9201265.1 SCP-like extracellular [Paenibacillus sp. PL91]
MKKYIVIAALLMLAGCSNDHNAANKQSALSESQRKTTTIHSVPNVTQASSVATPQAGKSSITMKKNNHAIPKWISGNQDPIDYAPEQPATSLEFDQKVLQIVNAERSKAGLSSLSMDSNLSKMAMVKAQDMINNQYFDHNSPTYGSPFDMMKKFQITYNAAGENIAKGQPTPEQVMNDWMNSEGHRANILSGSFSKIGIAYFKGAWVQEFTG